MKQVHLIIISLHLFIIQHKLLLRAGVHNILLSDSMLFSCASFSFFFHLIVAAPVLARCANRLSITSVLFAYISPVCVLLRCIMGIGDFFVSSSSFAFPLASAPLYLKLSIFFKLTFLVSAPESKSTATASFSAPSAADAPFQLRSYSSYSSILVRDMTYDTARFLAGITFGVSASSVWAAIPTSTSSTSSTYSSYRLFRTFSGITGTSLFQFSAEAEPRTVLLSSEAMVNYVSKYISDSDGYD